MIHHSDDWLTIHQGDVRDVLPTLPADSVDCIVTSPPYWGLRDYGTATWIGGDEACAHAKPRSPKMGTRSTLHGGIENILLAQEGVANAYRDTCPECGAIRQDGQLGLEATPEQYVANLVGVFRELRRVLQPSGTCWLNLGDSYAANQRQTQTVVAASNGKTRDEMGRRERAEAGGTGWQDLERRVPSGLKPKDLVGIPWRVAFALQADGWWLRSDIIWSKPNPMPESVTDRPTKAHEYLFLLTKSAGYYYDADAVREAAIYEGTVVKASNPDTAKNGQKGTYGATAFGFTQHDTVVGAGRNLRSVWSIATRPYPGAHFAVFPPELPERCIKAGSPELGTVLDPFAGSGTVGLVANRLSRRAILIDLNPAYLEQQMKRNAQTVVGL
jgi:site-specific DNA-methyltransferase (cytosine-N4-specific)